MCWWYQAVYLTASEFVIASEACPREQPHKHMLNFVPDSRVTSRNIDNALTIHTWQYMAYISILHCSGICRVMIPWAACRSHPSSSHIRHHPTKKLVGWLQGWDPMHKALLLWAALLRSTLGIPESCGNWAIAKQTSCGIHVQQQTMVTICHNQSIMRLHFSNMHKFRGMCLYNNSYTLHWGFCLASIRTDRLVNSS